MNILKRLQNALSGFRNGITTGMSIEELIRELSGQKESDAGISVSPESAMKLSTVYACVRVLAETCAQLPLPIYRRTASGRELDREHPLFQILNGQANKWQTAFEFREMMTAFVVLRGNAYAFKARNLASGAIMGLIPLKPGTVKPRQLEDLSIVYDYSPPTGGQTTFTQNDILHLRGLSGNGIEGMTPITAFCNAVGLAVAAERQQAKSFGRAVRFPGVLKSTKPLSDTAIKRLREDFHQIHSGENVYTTPVLEDGMEWQTVGMSATDAQTIETRQFQRGEIASIFRVPLHMINGDTEASKGWSTLEQQASEFVTYSMMPWFVRWEQAIRRDLLNPAEQKLLYATHNVDGLLRGDTTARFAAYNVAIGSGWLNRNEVREKENLNRVEGLDDYLTPLNMQKAIADEQQRQKDQRAKP